MAVMATTMKLCNSHDTDTALTTKSLTSLSESHSHWPHAQPTGTRYLHWEELNICWGRRYQALEPSPGTSLSPHIATWGNMNNQLSCHRPSLGMCQPWKASLLVNFQLQSRKLVALKECINQVSIWEAHDMDSCALFIPCLEARLHEV